MDKILDRFYAVGGRNHLARSHLESTDKSLSIWYRKLPPHLAFEPSSKQGSVSQPVPAPNVIVLLTTYNALKSFYCTGHLLSMAAPGELAFQVTHGDDVQLQRRTSPTSFWPTNLIIICIGRTTY